MENKSVFSNACPHTQRWATLHIPAHQGPSRTKRPLLQTEMSSSKEAGVRHKDFFLSVTYVFLKEIKSIKFLLQRGRIPKDSRRKVNFYSPLLPPLSHSSFHTLCPLFSAKPVSSSMDVGKTTCTTN